MTRAATTVGGVLLRRSLGAVSVLAAVSVLVFLSTALAAGDAASTRLGPAADPAAVHALRVDLGLDRPAPQRYLAWLGGLVRGDLGTSLVTGEPVAALVAVRLEHSMVLAAAAAVLLAPMVVILGTLAGVRAGGRADRTVGAAGLVLLALPEFVVGVALVTVFAVGLGWLPAVSYLAPGVAPWRQPAALVLPVLTLTLVCLAPNVRLLRAGVAVASAGDAAGSARLNGVPQWRVTWSYVLPQALPPALPMLARHLSYLIGGALVVETVFGYPGLASALVEAVNTRDVPVVQAVALIAAAATVALNLAADLITRALGVREPAR